MATAKTKANTIEIKIFGAAEGFLPKALMLAYPTAAMTAEGPKVLKSIIIITVRFFIV